MLRCFLFAMRFQLGTSPPRGTVGCATIPFRVVSRLFVSPSAALAVRGRVLTLVSLIIAPALYFNRISSSRPLHHAGDLREGFADGLPYNGACIFRQLRFFAFFLIS